MIRRQLTLNDFIETFNQYGRGNSFSMKGFEILYDHLYYIGVDDLDVVEVDMAFVEMPMIGILDYCDHVSTELHDIIKDIEPKGFEYTIDILKSSIIENIKKGQGRVYQIIEDLEKLTDTKIDLNEIENIEDICGHIEDILCIKFSNEVPDHYYNHLENIDAEIIEITDQIDDIESTINDLTDTIIGYTETTIVFRSY